MMMTLSDALTWLWLFLTWLLACGWGAMMGMWSQKMWPD